MNSQSELLVSTLRFTKENPLPISNELAIKKKKVRFNLIELIGIGAELYAQQFDSEPSLEEFSEISLSGEEQPLECFHVDESILVDLYDRSLELQELVDLHRLLFHSIQISLGGPAKSIDFFFILYLSRDVAPDMLWLEELQTFFNSPLTNLFTRFKDLIGYQGDNLSIKKSTRTFPIMNSLDPINIEKFRMQLNSQEPDFFSVLHCELFRSLRKFLGSRWEPFYQTFHAPISYVDHNTWKDSVYLSLIARPDLLGNLMAIMFEDLYD